MNDKIVFTGYIIYLEHLDTVIQPVTHIKKAITIKHNAAWMIEFTSSPPISANGGEECTRQLEYSNTMVSIVRYNELRIQIIYMVRSWVIDVRELYNF